MRASRVCFEQQCEDTRTRFCCASGCELRRQRPQRGDELGRQPSCSTHLSSFLWGGERECRVTPVGSRNVLRAKALSVSSCSLAVVEETIHTGTIGGRAKFFGGASACTTLLRAAEKMEPGRPLATVQSGATAAADPRMPPRTSHFPSHGPRLDLLAKMLSPFTVNLPKIKNKKILRIVLQLFPV